MICTKPGCGLEHAARDTCYSAKLRAAAGRAKSNAAVNKVVNASVNTSANAAPSVNTSVNATALSVNSRVNAPANCKQCEVYVAEIASLKAELEKLRSPADRKAYMREYMKQDRARKKAAAKAATVNS